MKATIFAKKRTMETGKTFYSYITRLVKKDGTDLVATVKFRDECGAPRPELCPLNIEFDKAKANLAPRNYINKDGLEETGYTLWLSEWKEAAEKYVDHSMDDFE